MRMAKLFSFFSLLVASLLLMIWLESSGFLNAVYKKISSSLTMVVYFEENITDNEIEDFKRATRDYKEISPEKFNNSSSLYEKLKKDPAISKQLEQISGDFRFPANYEFLIKDFDIEKIRNIVKQIKDFKIVQHVEVHFELIRQAGDLIKKIRKVKILSGWILLILGICFFCLSGYLRGLTDSGGRHRFFSGICAGLFGLLLCYSLVNFVGVGFYIGVFKSVLIITAIGVISSL